MTRSLTFLIVLALVPAIWLSVTLAGRVDDTVELAAVSTSTDRLPSGFGAFIATLHDRTPPTAPPTTTTTPKLGISERKSKFPSDELLHDLAMCETGGKMDNPNTGNGYYGFFQYDVSTWHEAGQAGVASDYSYEHQREVTRGFILRVGWSRWPTCSRVIGAR